MSLLKQYNKSMLLFIFLCLLNLSLFSQTEDSLYFINFAYHSDGSLGTHLPPESSFMVFLNGDKSKILIENAPRWKAGADPNINGKGMFGIELGNFKDPAVKKGDSISIVFTCTAKGEQGILSEILTDIPLARFPQLLNLSKTGFPEAPQKVNAVISDGKNIISWISAGGNKYSVYRKCFQDTLLNGKCRNLFYCLADQISENTFIDNSIEPDKTYSYIVFAISAGIYSPHSPEVIGNTLISNLSIVPTATTMFLKWNSLSGSNQKIMGYNIYRKSDDIPEWVLTGYTDSDTAFRDSRLSPGTLYYYKVKGRINTTTETGESDEVQATTSADKNKYYTYANLKTAIVIYTNTNKGTIPSYEIDRIKYMLELGKIFYWRNTGMKLNIEFKYYIISEYKVFEDPEDHWGNTVKTAKDLEALGVVNTEFDIIYMINTATNGYYSWGAPTLPLPGPSRRTGFSWVHWPVSTGVVYPGYYPGVTFGLTWVFVHECQHAIDGVYEANNHPEMYQGDVPWECPIPCGEHFDFQSKIFRAFNKYEDLLKNWGQIYESIDSDKDGFPDEDTTLAMDEKRFKSSNKSVDTDNDGLCDRDEFMNGVYSGSNPNNPDTDNDGIKDGEDPYPRYPVKKSVKFFTPQLDGVIESGWSLLNDTVCYTQLGYSPKLYVNFDNDYLYIGIYLNRIADPELIFDFQNDGRWFGAGNLELKISLDNNRLNKFHFWDASNEVKSYCQSIGACAGGSFDDDPSYIIKYKKRIIDPNIVKLFLNKSNLPIVQIEMAIPKSEYAGITLKEGDKIGINTNYYYIDNGAEWATTFDQYSYTYFNLGDKSNDVDKPGRVSNLKYSLLQNYPNPFNPITTISYTIPKEEFVSIKVFNILGSEVTNLVNEKKQPGEYKINLNGINLPSGMYFYKMEAGAYCETKKLILIK